MRVLLLTKGLGPGGAERLLVEQARARAPEVEYHAAYLLPWKQHLVADLEGLGVPTHCLGVRTEADLRWLRRLARLLRDQQFDVLHAHSPVSGALARVLVRTVFPTVGFVYTEHNRWPSHHRATRALNRATFSLSDAALAVSGEVADSMTPAARARTEVVIHGIDLEAVRVHRGARDAVRSELGVGPDEVLAVTVANLRANKRYPDLLAAARRVLDAGAPVRFVAAGQGPLEDEIRREHTRLDLGDRFRLLGYRDDAPRVIAAADLFVLASSHEGLPVAVMEALALGVPVVATAVGGLFEAITDGVDGLLVPPEDPEALAAAILRAAQPSL
ncbi:MAG: glycosyltransferase, partial [Actinomycetota bacterium]